MMRPEFLRRPAVADAIALAAVPLFAKLFTSIPLSPSGIDPWLYYAYGTDFPRLLARFGWTYYAARLSWDLIIGVYFSIFSPAFALALLGASVCGLGSISLYAILRSYYTRTAAFLGAFALASNYWFIDHSFWLYVDGPAIALSLFSIATFIPGLRSGASLPFWLSGIAFTLGVNTHIVVLGLVPSCLGLILLTERPPRTWKLLTGIVGFCVAAIVAMLALCVIAWFAFGNFWFFLTSLSTVKVIVSGGWHSWVRPFSSWIFGATAFLMPVGVLLVGAIVFVRDSTKWPLQCDAWIVGYAIFLAACVVFSDAVLDAGRLQHSYYFIYLWIPAFLLLGAVIARLADGLGSFAAAAMTATVVIGLGTLLLSGEYRAHFEVHPVRLTIAAYAVLAILFLIFAGSVSALQKGGRVVRMIGLLAGVAFVSVASATDFRVVNEQPLGTTLDFQTTVEAQRFIENAYDPNRKLLIWYNTKAPGSSEFVAINSTFLFGYSWLNDSMPNLTPADLQKMTGPSTVVLLSMDQAAIGKAVKTLRDRGFVEQVAAKTELGPVGRRIDLWIVTARGAAEAKTVVATKSSEPNCAATENSVVSCLSENR